MYVVRKMNGRMWIVNETDPDASKFTPPDWLRVKVPHRQAYQDLADQINNGKHYVDALVDFYGTWHMPEDR